MKTKYNCNLQLPSLPPNSDKLPELLNIGKRAKVTGVEHSWLRWEGRITQHYINNDDCSGDWGREMYCIEKSNKEQFSVLVKDCELL